MIQWNFPPQFSCKVGWTFSNYRDLSNKQNIKVSNCWPEVPSSKTLVYLPIQFGQFSLLVTGNLAEVKMFLSKEAGWHPWDKNSIQIMSRNVGSGGVFKADTESQRTVPRRWSRRGGGEEKGLGRRGPDGSLRPSLNLGRPQISSERRGAWCQLWLRLRGWDVVCFLSLTESLFSARLCSRWQEYRE